MKVPLGASGSSQITAKLIVPSGAAPKERGGESFFPVHVNVGSIGPPAVSAGEVSSMVFILRNTPKRNRGGQGHKTYRIEESQLTVIWEGIFALVSFSSNCPVV